MHVARTEWNLVTSTIRRRMAKRRERRNGDAASVGQRRSREKEKGSRWNGTRYEEAYERRVEGGWDGGGRRGYRRIINGGRANGERSTQWIGMLLPEIIERIIPSFSHSVNEAGSSLAEYLDSHWTSLDYVPRPITTSKIKECSRRMTLVSSSWSTYVRARNTRWLSITAILQACRCVDIFLLRKNVYRRQFRMIVDGKLETC